MSLCVVCGVRSGRRLCRSCENLWTSPLLRASSEPETPEPREPEWVAQTVMGQRLWRWIPGDGLHGMVCKWESGFMQAECTKGKHDAPYWTESVVPPETSDPYIQTWHSLIYDQPLCLCGVNAWKLTHLFDEMDLGWAQGLDFGTLAFQPEVVEALPVLGIMELGGEVHEYEKGYRAEYGLIVEGTVLTSLPVDESALSELETTYDAPFRVRTYDDWKTEWEATYGRDRETAKKDQSAETGTTTIQTFTGSVTSTGTSPASQIASLTARMTALHQKQWDQIFFTSAPRSWWRRVWDWLVFDSPFLLVPLAVTAIAVGLTWWLS